MKTVQVGHFTSKYICIQNERREQPYCMEKGKQTLKFPKRQMATDFFQHSEENSVEKSKL